MNKRFVKLIQCVVTCHFYTNKNILNYVVGLVFSAVLMYTDLIYMYKNYIHFVNRSNTAFTLI